MKNMNKQFRKSASVLGVVLGCFVVSPVLADDIEIYTDANLVGPLAQPNIMFIMDSSSSMAANLPAAVGYDYTVAYDLAGGYDPGLVYYTSDGSVAATNDPGFVWAANQCKHSLIDNDPANGGWQPPKTGSLYTTGMYSGQVAMLDVKSASKASWGALNKNKPTALVECIQDHGIHGKNGGAVNFIDDTVAGWDNVDNNVAAAVWASNANNYVLFAGNYLNYLVDPAVMSAAAIAAGAPVALFDQMKNAIETLVKSVSNVNIGLMQYDSQIQVIDLIDQGGEGGAVMYPALDVNLGRQDFYSRLKTMKAQGDPVISETYYEALRYFGGKDIYYGDDANPSNQTGTKENGNPKFYETPITETCQKNYVIAISGGLSRYDYLDQAEREYLPGFDAGQCNTGPYPGSNANQDAFNSDGSTIDNCLDEMAGWALTNDVADRSFAAHSGDQNITTYTVGFAFPPIASAEHKAGEQLLRDTAEKGGGRFLEARNEADLVRVLNELISEILKVNSTFSSPAVSVNAFNRATNLEDLYFTLFKPTAGEHWEGNLKKFKLEFDAGGLPFVADANHNPAIDTATGFFKDSSVSYWTQAADAPDGAETRKGGAAGNILLPRSAYTYTGTYTGASGVLQPANTNLAIASNSIIHINSNITDALLGGVAVKPDVLISLGTISVNFTYRDALLLWTLGFDFQDIDGDGLVFEERREMGDPLHAEPALVQYGLTAGGEPDLVAYVATNDGYLHAFDTMTGRENFAFVPQEMLPELQNIFDNTGVNGKAYGLDGNVVPWINDVNRDGNISGASEHVYLYFGMRRGGRYIYSMDVTDRNAPKLRWIIDGGSADYAELGETWSAPNVEKIKMAGADRTVLIFGAGYDVTQDTLTTRGPDGVGRGIFIVDADTGDLLWRAGPDGVADLQLTDMQYSMPARVKPIDIDGDGYVDRLYAGDMGGQLWRIDIDNDANAATSLSVTGGRIANLAIDGSVNDNRRFYNPPDAALIIEEGQAPYISIVAASGYRAHPLQTNTKDRAYMIRDYDVYQAPSPYITVTEADLFDTTDNTIGQGTQTGIDTAKVSLGSAKGWYITLQELDGSFVGEKALSEPLILNGVAIFTTFIPASAGLTVDTCKANDGTGAIYFVNVIDGTPTDDNTGDETKTREDRRILLARGGIPPTPRVIITDDGIPTLCVGTECSKSGDVGTVQKMYWYEVEE